MGHLTKSLVDNFYNPRNVSLSYRKATGKTIRDNLSEAIKLMVGQWKKQDSLRSPFTGTIAVTNKREEYTSYRSVVVVSRDSVFAVKSDLNEINRLVLINGTEEDN